MKVKELIESLKVVDGELDVVVYMYDPAFTSTLNPVTYINVGKGKIHKYVPDTLLPSHSGKDMLVIHT